MSTVKIVLRKKPNKKTGTCPLALRIIKDRVPVFVHLGYRLLPVDWDEDKQLVKKSHPNSVRLNNMLLKKLAETSDKTIEAETNNEDVTAKALKEKVKRTSGKSFFKQADIYLKRLKEAGNFNVYTADKPRIKHFKQFLQGADITFPEITEALLNDFKHYLAIRHRLPTDQTVIVKRATALKPALRAPKVLKPYGERSIVNHFVTIRSIFSMAIKDKTVEDKYYPFGDGKISIKFPESNKVGLEIINVKNLENVELINPNYNHARNLWLISFYFGGMRAGDLLSLRWSDFNNLRLQYKMNKNGKIGSLKASDKALSIFEQYADGKRTADDFIFPELKKIEDLNDTFLVKRRINDCISSVDKFLRKHVAPAAGITQKLTMHIARHTFGNLSGETIPIKTLQKIFRHSSVVTTIGYMANFTTKDTDDALDAVTNF